MIWIDILYNGSLLSAECVLWWYMGKTRTVTSGWFGIAGVAIAAVVLSLLAWGMFMAMRFLAFGVFVHVPLTLVWAGYTVGRNAWRWAAVWWSVALVIGLIAADAFWLEPHWLEETTYRVRSDKLHRPLRLVLVADLQTDRVGAYEQRVLRRVSQLQPDMVLFAGDYVQLPGALEQDAQWQDLNRLLHELRLAPPLGIYAVGGNVDPPGWQRVFDGFAGEFSDRTHSETRGEVRVTCLGLADSFNPELALPPSDHWHIVLGHAPDFALGDVQADLLLAGHVHGGQVRLPGLGPLITLSQVPRQWAAGRTRLDGDRDLIVSRGIGMERGTAPRLRFLCRPELIVIDALPQPGPADRS